jgi:hypothetical protein
MGAGARLVRRAAVAAFAALVVTAPAHAQGTGVSYRATFSPREALFGDPLDARVDVVVERALVAADSVRVHTDFRPYVPVATQRTDRPAGRFTRVEYRYRLLCLRKRCLPNGEERTITFAPVRITWRGEGRAQTQTILWPALRLASRLDPSDLSEPTLRSDVVRQPAMTWGIDPKRAIVLLLAVAAFLLAYPLVLAVRLVRRALYVLRTRRFDRLSPLERALELLRRAAAAEESAPSRRALERVARELHEHPLGEDARKLAWSRPGPGQEEMESFRSRVEGDRGS